MRAARWTVVASLVGVVLLQGVPASAEPTACQRTIARAAASLAQSELGALAGCARDRLAGKSGPETDCANDAAVQAARAKAESSLRRAIGRACGGADHRCDSNDGDDEPLAAIGWDVGACPGFEGGGCIGTIADCDDVATCIACVTDAAVTQAAGLYGATALPAPFRSEAQRCQDTIVRESTRFFQTRAKTVQRCEDLVLRGVAAGPCPSGNAKTVAAIARAAATQHERICKACGGTDEQCDGAGDLPVDAIDFAASCPPLSLGGESCGGTVDQVADVVACTQCVSTFKGDCLDALVVPAVKSYPAGCALQPTPTPTLTPTPSATATPPAGAPAIKCERAIVKESTRLARARVGVLGRCAEDKLAGKLPPDADCLTATKAGPLLAKAEARLAQKIANACGGADHSCSAGDVGRDADLPPPTIGWSPGQCPGFVTTDCDGAVVDCGDIATCITCVQRGAVDQTLALGFGSTAPASVDTPLGKCQRALGRATGDLLAARAKGLQRCADAAITSGSTAACPAGASAAIAKAEDAFLATVCSACGGADRSCGGADDLTPAALGFPASCPSVAAPGGACGGPLTTLSDLAQCLGCVSAFDNTCADQIAIPDLRGYDDACRASDGGVSTPTPSATAPTPSPTPGGICGNDVVEPGEDCDDGNVESCDACPANCRVAPVACPTAGRYAQTVHVARNDGQTLTSTLLCLAYPVGTVALPGSGLVTQRVSGFPGIATVNDFDASARIALVGQQQLAAIDFTVSFDLCSNATTPPAADFACGVISASNSGATVDPATVSCTPVTP